MKVLFLDHPQADFLAAIVRIGLHEILGADGVVEFPYKESYHGGTETLIIDDRTPPAVTAPFTWMPTLPGHRHSEDEVLALLNGRALDAVVLASPRSRNTRALRNLIDRLGRERMPPILFMDGEDYARSEWDLIDELRPCAYLKRECFETGDYGRNFCRIVPFPFASPVPPAEPIEKTIDVLFLGGHSWPERRTLCEALRGKFGDRFVGGTDVHFDYTGYLHAINRARVAISIRGLGADTLRFWEIPSFETMLVADRLPTVKPAHPFIDGEHCRYYSSAEELLGIVEHTLTHEDERARIARAGNAHLRAHHTARARAQQLIDQIR